VHRGRSQSAREVNVEKRRKKAFHYFALIYLKDFLKYIEKTNIKSLQFFVTLHCKICKGRKRKGSEGCEGSKCKGWEEVRNVWKARGEEVREMQED
jgi:hypothetical protein